MDQRSIRLGLTVCLVLLALAGGQAVMGEQPGAPASGATTANARVSLRGTAPTTPVEAPAIAQPDRTTSDSSEGLPLGTPNGPMSARPNDDAEPSGRSYAGVIESTTLGSEAPEPATGMDAYIPESARVVGALVLVVGLIFMTRWAMRRAGGLAGGDRPSGVLEVLARYPVARGQQLVLLKFARRILLVHQSGGAMTILTEINDGDEVAALLARIEAGSRGAAATKFRSILKRFESEHEGGAPAARPSTSRRAARAGGETPFGAEVIDLTRRSGGLMSRLSGASRS